MQNKFQISLSLVVLLIAIFAFFSPQLDNKIISGGDVVSSTAWSKQVLDDYEKTGELSNWNPSMFSGMPWGLLTAGHQYNLVKSVDKVLRLGVKPPLGLALKCGLLCFIALILLDVSPLIALFGALAFTFNTNYLVLLEAGHQSKLSVLANFPLLIAGLMLCFRGRWQLGAPAIAFATSIAIANNHIQMIYYLLLSFVIFGMIYLLNAIRKDQLGVFLKMSAIALCAALIGAGSNFSLLRSAKDFSEDTMRGKSILGESTVTQQSGSSSTKDGLAWNYAMQWSHSSKDLPGLLIPRATGGSSYEEVGANTKLGRLLKSNNAKRGYDNTYQAPLYWGDMPGTSGPPYLGIVLLAVCVFGFVVVSRPIKIAVIAVSVFIVLLTLGRNAPLLNRTLFDVLPLFDKFRAPNSAIHVLIPFMAIFSGITLKSFFERDVSKISVRPIIIGLGGLLCVLILFALFGPYLYSFEGSGDARYQEAIRDIFVQARKSVFVADAWRSTIFVLAVAGVLLLYIKNILKSQVIVTIILAGLTFLDLYSVGRRHLDADNWEAAKEYNSNFSMRPVDQQILNLEKRGRGYYRVFDVAGFRTATPSYYHNTIGGYHAAKLQRYQDLIDYHISKGNAQVVNMLNGKYYIGQDQKLSVNPDALGNAWSVDNIQYVSNPNDEIAALGNLNTRTTAVVNKEDFPQVLKVGNSTDGSCEVVLTDYQLNHLTYQSNCTSRKLVVFSEIWYDQRKGMTAKIDGEEVDFVRANYVLRALEVPAGQHSIEFEFKPVIKGAGVSITCSLFIWGMILMAILNYCGIIPGRFFKQN